MCEAQLDALLAGVIVAAEKRVGRKGAGQRRAIANPIGCTAQPERCAWSSLALEGRSGKSRSSRPFLFATVSPFSLGLLLADCDSARGCGNHPLAA